jgi:hypothetical protein
MAKKRKHEVRTPGPKTMICHMSHHVFEPSLDIGVVILEEKAVMLSLHPLDVHPWCNFNPHRLVIVIAEAV